MGTFQSLESPLIWQSECESVDSHLRSHNQHRRYTEGLTQHAVWFEVLFLDLTRLNPSGNPFYFAAKLASPLRQKFGSTMHRWPSEKHFRFSLGGRPEHRLDGPQIPLNLCLTATPIVFANLVDEMRRKRSCCTELF